VTLKSLESAIAEAERFIVRAKDARRLGGIRDGADGQRWVREGQHAAAAKRASLDLTRALAYMRNGG
jgi:hypothetical protein